MGIDLELYRRQVTVSTQPNIHLSAIDIAPDYPLRTIIFLHGYGGQALQWEHQLRQFSFNNRVIAPDLRGHGRSDQPDANYTMTQMIQDLEAALDELAVSSNFVLVGHSFGGAIATELAHRKQERVEKLVLIGAAGEFKLKLLYRLLLKLPLPILRAARPFVRNWLAAPPHVMYAWYHQMVARWNGWYLFRNLRVPTLVVRGQYDLIFAKPLFEQVTKAIPGAEEVDVGASGHLVMLERRQAVNRAIQRSLEQKPTTWREETSSLEHTYNMEFLQKHPWLPFYDTGVPYSIAIPRVPLHHLLRSAANRFPLNTAIVFAGNRITYRRLNQEVNRFANGLRSLGVNSGDRVMLLLPNLPQLVIGFYGTLAAGAVAVFTLPTTEPAELSRQMQECGAKVLVTMTNFADLVHIIKTDLEQKRPSLLQHIIYAHPWEYVPLLLRIGLQFSKDGQKPISIRTMREKGIHRFTQFLYQHSHISPETNPSSEDLAVIVYTGGTTAAPKGVMLSHRNLVANALQTRHWMPSAEEGKERFLSVLPIFHSYGLTAALNVPITLGATIILKPKFEVSDILNTIKRYRPTIFPGVPQMYVAIKDFTGVRKYGIQSIKACISGSAPLAVEVQEAFEKLTRGHLVEGYGLTEAAPVTHANPLLGTRKVGSIGIPLPSTEARVVNLLKGKKEVKPGQIGELAVRGPQVMMGYWALPQETKQVLDKSGWLLTGDVAQMDAEGYFRIIARKADMWYPEKPGKPAFPRDIEEVLYEVPQVREVAVVAIADQPIAFVISQQERPSSEALIAYCKRRLPPELVPRLIIFVDDFPRTFIGKVIRRELAKRYEQRQTVER